MVYHRLNLRLDVWRAVGVADGSGGRSQTWTPAGTVRARVVRPRATEQVSANQAGARVEELLQLAPNADVRRGDQLRPAGAAAGSRPYRLVVAVVDPSGGTHRQARCEQVQADT